MTAPTFQKPDSDSIVLATDGYGIWSGSSQANIKMYPRTKGGIVKSSNIIERNVTIKCYLVPPTAGVKRVDLEGFMNALNEQVVGNYGTLVLSGNTYQKCYVSNISYDPKYVTNYVTYDINCIIGAQDDVDPRTQLAVPDLLEYSRGRAASFTAVYRDVTRTFYFWHNVDSVRNYEADVTVNSTSASGVDNITINGGFERVLCDAWFITGDEGTRQTIEAYMFNMINGPLGLVGTLKFDDREPSTWNNCFLEGVEQDSQLFNGSIYRLTFLTSLQC